MNCSVVTCTASMGVVGHIFGVPVLCCCGDGVKSEEWRYLYVRGVLLKCVIGSRQLLGGILKIKKRRMSCLENSVERADEGRYLFVSRVFGDQLGTGAILSSATRSHRTKRVKINRLNACLEVTK